jgi:chemotaxis protein CheY-P-specific phosphatase CheC
MLETIAKAAENFISHQLGAQPAPAALPDKMRTLIAYIDTESPEGSRRIYIGCCDRMIALIVEVMLGEPLEDEETLTDMTLETVNLIVGSAKVLLQEQHDTAMTIQTPHFVKYDLFDVACDATIAVSAGEGTMIIGIKEMQ